jgi:hypothetical protein
MFAVEFGAGVGTGLFTSWLCEKLKGRATKLKIERTEVEIEAGEIKLIVVEKIER